MKKAFPFFLILVFVFSLATISVFADDPTNPGDPESPDDLTVQQAAHEDDSLTTRDFYTIINGYGTGYVLGYPDLNNTGDIFPIAVKNVATGKIIPSFCAHAGSRNFAGDSNLDCSGYLVAEPSDLYAFEGVHYSSFVSAYNYIADFYGKLDENRALTQVVTWVLLGSIDIDSDAFSAIDDWKLDKDAVRDVMENHPGYTGNRNIVDIMYLLCEHHHDLLYCQPQLVPIYTSCEWKPGNTEEPDDPDDDDNDNDNNDDNDNNNDDNNNDDGDDVDDNNNNNDDNNDNDNDNNDDKNNNDDGDDADNDNNNSDNNNDNNDEDDGDDIGNDNESDDTGIPDEHIETTNPPRSSSSTNRNNSANSNDNNITLPAEPLDRGTDYELEAVFEDFDENQEVPLGELPEGLDTSLFDGFDAGVPASGMPRTGLNDLLWIYIIGLICSGIGLVVCIVSTYRTKRVRD